MAQPTPRRMTRDNIIHPEPWTTIRDYPEHPRFYRTDLYRSLAEQERIARVEADVRRDLRVMRWQSRIKWFCIATAFVAAWYFVFQLGRGVL